MLSCCKHEVDCQRNKYIIAGEKGGCIIYHDFNPDLEVTADTKIGSIDTLSIDLNGDNIKDITLKSTDTTKAEIIPLKSTIISGEFREVSYNYFGYITKYNISDKIENKNWSPRNITLAFSLLDRPWYNSDHQYMGVCFVNGKDTIFGWVCLSLIGKSHIIIHDCAYQK
jgi:hypothetical protein